MAKFFKNTRFLLALCVLSMLAACVPAGLSALNILHLRTEIEQIEKVSLIADHARDVSEIVGHSVHHFMAMALELTAEERTKITDKADLQFNGLERAVEDLRDKGKALISKQQDTKLVEAIRSISHSWQDIREEAGEPIPAAEKSYHFLKMFEDLQRTHEILAAIEHSTDAAVKSATALSFKRIEQALLLFILVLSGSAVIGVLAITGSYQFARTMRRSNEHFNVALANMSHGLVMFDSEQRIIVSNERYASMYGLSPEQMKQGTSVRQILDYRLANGIYTVGMDEELLEKAIASVQAGAYGKRVQHLNDGRIFEITHSPMSDGGWLATHEDITSRKRAEEELVEHRDHLQELVDTATRDLKDQAQMLQGALTKEKELNEMQRQFVSMASHELRTPLAIIDSSAQRLKKSADRLSSEDALSRIEKIRAAVQRMMHLMNSTLTSARMEEGKVAVDPQPCDISELISDACIRMQEISKDHVITCEINEMPPVMMVDSGALDQVLTNLISNAVKYAPGAPDISVKAYGNGSDVIIQVRDRGLGIDEDDIPRLFTRFFRARTSTGIAGTGIGLNLVKQLLELHGGSITVASTKGNGSTFSVRLPVTCREQTEHTETQAA